MLFCMLIFGPITEEFFFRGAGLRGFGNGMAKIFAIVMTAIFLSGLIHANFDQLFSQVSLV